MNIEREYAFGVIPFYRLSLGEYIFFIGLTQNEDGREQFWKFPKGHKNSEDEEDTDTALRELLEETGISLSREALIKSVSFAEEYFFERRDVVVRKMNTYFLGQVREADKNNVILDEKEFVRHEWVNFEELKELLPENSRSMLVDAHDFLVRHRV